MYGLPSVAGSAIAVVSVARRAMVEIAMKRIFNKRMIWRTLILFLGKWRDDAGYVFASSRKEMLDAFITIRHHRIYVIIRAFSIHWIQE